MLAYARETVKDRSGSAQHQRVRWWSALALLRAIGSSPAAAAATLRERSRTALAADAAEADVIGRLSVLDLDEESAEGADVIPGADPEELEATLAERTTDKLLRLAREADALRGKDDVKLAKGTAVVKGLVADGYAPIVFCRFIDTAEYVKDALRAALPKDVAVEAVTGLLPPDERRARVDALAQEAKRVLVATDCLSEGINLQEGFDAVVHYDLSWNPTRHEQREGRVDRYGQRRPEVKVVTLYGSNNPIDGIVLSVLLRKHRTIRSSLGISVPVPVDSNAVLEAILEGILIRGRDDQSSADQLGFWEREIIEPKRQELADEWDRVAERERASRSRFAQHAFPLEEVLRARDASRSAVGSGIEVGRFATDALGRLGASVVSRDGRVEVDLREVPTAVRDLIGLEVRERLRLRFAPPLADGEQLVGRTHPIVSALSAHLVDTALDPQSRSIARRAGVIRTAGVTRRTTALLLRLRYDLRTRTRGAGERVALAEEVRVLGFSGPPSEATLIDEAGCRCAPRPRASGNVNPDLARQAIEDLVAGLDALLPVLERLAAQRAADLEAEHERVRDIAATARTHHRHARSCRSMSSASTSSCRHRWPDRWRSAAATSAPRSAPRVACCRPISWDASPRATPRSRASRRPTTASRRACASARPSPQLEPARGRLGGAGGGPGGPTSRASGSRRRIAAIGRAVDLSSMQLEPGVDEDRRAGLRPRTRLRLVAATLHRGGRIARCIRLQSTTDRPLWIALQQMGSPMSPPISSRPRLRHGRPVAEPR